MIPKITCNYIVNQALFSASTATMWPHPLLGSCGLDAIVDLLLNASGRVRATICLESAAHIITHVLTSKLY